MAAGAQSRGEWPTLGLIVARQFEQLRRLNALANTSLVTFDIYSCVLDSFACMVLWARVAETARGSPHRGAACKLPPTAAVFASFSLDDSFACQSTTLPSTAAFGHQEHSIRPSSERSYWS
jgi:hypothetical protein